MKPSQIILFLLPFITLAHQCAMAQSVSSPVTRLSINLNEMFESRHEVDTTLMLSFIHHPLLEIDDSWTELGNTGSVALNNRFKGISRFYNVPMLNGILPYLSFNDAINYYVISSPFSMINYCSGGTEDLHGQTVKAIYSRNLSRNINLHANLRYYMGSGHYARQETSLSDVAIHYTFIKDHYKLLSRFTSLTQKQQENGGFVDDSKVSETGYPNLLPVRLKSADSRIRYLSIKAIQEFNLSKWNQLKNEKAEKVTVDTLGIDSLWIIPEMASADSLTLPHRKTIPLTFQHRFEYLSSYRLYQDANPLGGFYSQVLMDSTKTYDSTAFVKFDNQFLVHYEKIVFRDKPLVVEGGLQPVWYRFSYGGEKIGGIDLSLVGRAGWTKPTQQLDLSMDLSFLGRRAGDLDLNAICRFLVVARKDSTFLSLKTQIINSTPNPLLNQYKSNHFIWQNDFLDQSSILGEVGLDVPLRRFSSQLDAILIKNWIFFNDDALPEQSLGSSIVVQLNVNKHFVAGPFNTSVRLTGQYCSNGNIPLPMGIAGISTWMHHDIHFKVTGGYLQLEYGFEARYTTPYKGYAYMPATGMFYLQDERMMGNYPMMNAFIQFKIKRTRIFIQYNHLLQPLFFPEYFAALHYPYQQPNLKYGFYWHFYD